MKHITAQDARVAGNAQPLPTRHEGDPVHLTAKEHEVLLWAAIGKSVWEIARIQDRSEAAINFHMCNIRRKFGVSTIRAALVLAITQGLILSR